jgi:hypothetical protein
MTIRKPQAVEDGRYPGPGTLTIRRSSSPQQAKDCLAASTGLSAGRLVHQAQSSGPVRSRGKGARRGRWLRRWVTRRRAGRAEPVTGAGRPWRKVIPTRLPVRKRLHRHLEPSSAQHRTACYGSLPKDRAGDRRTPIRRLRVRVATATRPRTVIGVGLRDRGRGRERPPCPVSWLGVRVLKRGPTAWYTVIRHTSSCMRGRPGGADRIATRDLDV